MARGGIFTVQASIAEHVASALNVTLIESERRSLRTPLTQSPEAYETYLRGNQYAHGSTWVIPTNVRAAIDMYRQAVTLDPAFAEAHARLSMQYSALAGWGVRSADTALPLARRHAERALALNPDLAWGHLALANYFAYNGDWQQVSSEVALAEKFGSNSGEVLDLTTGLLSSLGEVDHVLRNRRRALELDPLSPSTNLGLGVDYFALRRHAEGAPYIDRAIALAPDKPESYMYKAWLQLSWHGSVADARSVLQTAVQRLGPERGFVAGFLSSSWWASRLLAQDRWYRSMLEHASLGPPDLDSADYYMHKAGLFEGVGQQRKARAYWDSVIPVLTGRLREMPNGSNGFTSIFLHQNLAWAYAGLGMKEEAILEARKVDNLDQRQRFQGPLSLALTYAAVGESEAAAAQFERVLSTPNWVTPKFLAIDPALIPLRQVPRFRRLLEHN
jgi:serine/threonine-protein kinase